MIMGLGLALHDFGSLSLFHLVVVTITSHKGAPNYLRSPEWLPTWSSFFRYRGRRFVGSVGVCTTLPAGPLTAVLRTLPVVIVTPRFSVEQFIPITAISNCGPTRSDVWRTVS